MLGAYKSGMALVGCCVVGRVVRLRLDFFIDRIVIEKMVCK